MAATQSGKGRDAPHLRGKLIRCAKSPSSVSSRVASCRAAQESGLAFVQQKEWLFVRLMETGRAIDSGRRGPALLSQLEKLRQML